MRIKCDYCGGFLDDADEFCPNCGSVNNQLKRGAEGIPTTIEGLRAFCDSKNLDTDKMRFFIGVDYQEPKAFGIYKDASGKCVVYKNKADGTRAIRYEGYDEAYAVNELYQKMKSESINQRAIAVGSEVTQSVYPDINGGGNNTNPPSNNAKKSGAGCGTILAIIFIVIAALILIIAWSDDGYSGGGYGYSYDSDYGYDSDYDSGSSWWDSGSSSDSSWDSGWDSGDWGSDSWDSGSTDWGSDW